MEKELKKSTKVILVLLVILICAGLYLGGVYLYKNKTVNDETLQKSETISNEKLYDLSNYPKVDASLATQPLTNAFIENFTGKQNIDEEILDYTNTHPGYVRLINDEVDLIVVTEPSKEELELAKEKGVELEVIPVVKEGFVFYVNNNNPIDSLSVEQIQKIYTGEITNWKQVGGEDSQIKAYQRPVNSGSQTGMLSLVMKGKKMMEPVTETIAQTMIDIVDVISDYNNGRNAIGYSYYYYATAMYDLTDENSQDRIKLLEVNGVKPSYDTIKDGSYPIQTAYYIVINKNEPEGSKTRELVKAMLSARGQNVAKDAGYVPVK